MLGMSCGIARNVAPRPVSLRNTLTRKRPPSADTYEKSRSLPLPKYSCWFLREDLGEIALELRVADVAELDRHEVAVHAQHGRHADGQVHVGAALLHAELQERVDAGHVGPILKVISCLAQACDGEKGVKCDAVRDSPRAARALQISERRILRRIARSRRRACDRRDQRNFSSAVAQLRHGLVALVLVDRHGLHDDFGQARRQRRD